MDEVIWKPVVGFEGVYEVSNLGIIKGIARKSFNPGSGSYINISQQYLRPKMDKDCYLDVALNANGKSTTKRIHRIVAEAFIPNPDMLPLVDHKNGVRWDNRVDNLRWSNQSDNIKDAFLSGRKRNSARPIFQFTMEGNFVKRFDAICHVERDGFDPKKVNAVVVGKRKSCGGYKWEYAKVDLE